MKLWDVVKYFIIIIGCAALAALAIGGFSGEFTVGVVIAGGFFSAACILFGFVWCAVLKDEAADRRACNLAISIINGQKARPCSYTAAAWASNKVLETVADELRRQMGVDR